MKTLRYCPLAHILTFTILGCSNLAPINRGNGGEAGEAGRTSHGSGGTSNRGGSAGTATTSQTTAAGSDARGGSGATTTSPSGGTATTGGMPGTGGTSSQGGVSSQGGTTPGQGGAGTTATTTQVTCPSSGGPAMVKLPDGYCIDSTEVTRAQYAAWLATVSAATVNAQDATTCGWNTSFDPASGSNCDPSKRCTSNCADYAQVCVDWCDAVAYCKGVGKRLCGSISGGPISAADFTDPKKSQWYNACSSGGKNVYPYGNTYQRDYCYTTYSQTTSTTRAVGTFAQCQPAVPYAGIYDLAGNAEEWQDSCASSAVDAPCLRVGGSSTGWYGATEEAVQSYTECARPDLTFPRNVQVDSLGFRCCYP
ncbi:MAG: SUMF1/EgtB/PvdO family nonheme iron enzyme [Polyangiaceae bacterium]